MSRVPIRWRLTLAFGLAMAVVLAATGAFVYARLGQTLLEQLDESLELRADALAAVAEAGGDVRGEGDDTVAQLVSPDGSGTAPLLSADEVRRAAGGPIFLERDALPALEGEPARLLARAEAGGVLVVAASLDDRDDALDALLAQLLVAGPLALLVATGAGYRLARAALGPVEAMRRRAELVSTEQEGQRLPLPAARDELRRLGETLNAMLARLEAGLVRERRFVADASHELRTPLAQLRAELELARRRPRPSAELEAALDSALEEVDRMIGLAEDLLVLARADDGRLPLRREQLSLVELLDAVARRFTGRASAEGRTIEVSAGAGGVILADRARLEQALGNLVDNAVRHGGGTVRLTASTDESGTALRVADEGPGFPPVFLPRAFDRFARADEARGGPSGGLGLAIVAAIARAHGGVVHAENGPEGGATVTLTLP